MNAIEVPEASEVDDELAAARNAHRRAVEARDKAAIARTAWRVWEILGNRPGSAWLFRKAGTL